MEEDEKQLSPPVWAVNYPDIGTLYRGEEGLGAALTDQAPAAETRSRALTSEELTALFREDLLRELGWDCGQLGGEALYDASGGPAPGHGTGGRSRGGGADLFRPHPGSGRPALPRGGRPRRDSDGDERDRGHCLAPDRGPWTETAGAEGLCHSQFLTGDHVGRPGD